MLLSRIAGRQILKDYEETIEKPKVLEKKIAAKLVNVITNWASENRIKFGKNEFKYISEEITKNFLCEKKVN